MAFDRNFPSEIADNHPMEELAQKVEPQKEVRPDSEHEEPATDVAQDPVQGAAKKSGATAKAGDAAARRMADKDKPKSNASKEELESEAGELEAQVLAMARDLGKIDDQKAAAGMQNKLQANFDKWKAVIDKLMAMGARSSPRVKSFVSKTEQAALIQANLAQTAQGKQGKAYADEAKKAVDNVGVAQKGQTSAGVM
jgi:hypothetical protein